jgi:tetratricopeptide (TPR) repeat protein
VSAIGGGGVGFQNVRSLGGLAQVDVRYEGTLVPRFAEDTSDEFHSLHDPESSWPEEYYPLPRRRRLGAFIVVVSMLLGLGLLGWAGEVRYHLVARFSGKTAPFVARVDPRLESFLADGERALLEGDLERAQGDFDKASVLAERAPRLLIDEARVAVATADVSWLKLRLLPTGAGGSVESRITRAQLDERSATARRAANEALSAAPGDAQAQRTVLDALRIAGEPDAARAYVVAVFATSSQPETAYVLAALDLAQPSPPWTVVLDRLRTGASVEIGAGRSRAALVYALAKSGDANGARAELAKLDALARPHPLLPELHAFVTQDASFAAIVPPLPVSAGTSPSGSSSAPQAREAPGAPAKGVSSDPAQGSAQSALEAAAGAIARHDLDRAEQIYRGILTANPNDSQAVAGTGDVARMRGDAAGAMSAYRRAIVMNPSYLPALLGLADTEWSAGDRAGAARVYKDIVSRFPEGTYPRYATSRAAGSG